MNKFLLLSFVPLVNPSHKDVITMTTFLSMGLWEVGAKSASFGRSQFRTLAHFSSMINDSQQLAIDTSRHARQFLTAFSVSLAELSWPESPDLIDSRPHPKWSWTRRTVTLCVAWNKIDQVFFLRSKFSRASCTLSTQMIY